MSNADKIAKLAAADAEEIDRLRDKVDELTMQLKPGRGELAGALLAMKTAVFRAEVDYIAIELFQKLARDNWPWCLMWMHGPMDKHRALRDWCVNNEDEESIQGSLDDLKRLHEMIGKTIVLIEKRKR